MSTWLKKQQPVRLYQSSEIPYVIREDGVHLCYDNWYREDNTSSDFNICFLTQSNLLKRINTFLYRFASFPVTIPFSDVVSLGDAIIEGRIIKTAGENQGEPVAVAVVKPSYIRNVTDSQLSELSEALYEYDKSFLLVEEEIDPQVHLFEDVAEILPHQDWNRTLVTIAHAICKNPARKYCWTQSLPELSLHCYGVDDSDEIRRIYQARDNIGLSDVLSVSWEI